ncbi:hypothetical protein N9Y17_00280 [Gammaproteobacteria bacterium]|nr:hypothetical protein [Gammaproteobacteria bacterium]
MPHTLELPAIESALQAIQQVCNQSFKSDLDLCRAILFDQDVRVTLIPVLELIDRQPDALKVHYRSRLINVSDLLEFSRDNLCNIKYVLPDDKVLSKESIDEQMHEFAAIDIQITGSGELQEAFSDQQKILTELKESLMQQSQCTPASYVSTPYTSGQETAEQNDSLELFKGGFKDGFKDKMTQARNKCHSGNLEDIYSYLLNHPKEMLVDLIQHFEPVSFQKALLMQNSSRTNYGKALLGMLQKLVNNPTQYPETSKALFATALRRLADFMDLLPQQDVCSIAHQGDVEKQPFEIRSYQSTAGHEVQIKYLSFSSIHETQHNKVLGEQLALALYQEFGMERETSLSYIFRDETLYVGMQKHVIEMNVGLLETVVLNQKNEYLVDVLLGNPQADPLVSPRFKRLLGNLLTQLMDGDVELENQIPQKLAVVDLFNGLKKLTEIENGQLEKCIDQYLDQASDFATRLFTRKEKLIGQVVQKIITELEKVDLFEQIQILQAAGIVDKEKAAKICQAMIKASDGGIEQTKKSIIDALKNSHQDHLAVVSIPEPEVNIQSAEVELNLKISTRDSSGTAKMIQPNEVSSSSSQQLVDEELIAVLPLRAIVEHLQAVGLTSFGFEEKDYFLMKVASIFHLTSGSECDQLDNAVTARQWLLSRGFSLTDADQVFDAMVLKGDPAQKTKTPYTLILNHTDLVMKSVNKYIQGCIDPLKPLTGKKTSVEVSEDHVKKTSQEAAVQVGQEVQKSSISSGFLVGALSSTVGAIGAVLLQKLGGFRGGKSNSKASIAFVGIGAGVGALIAFTYDKYATSKELTTGNTTEVTEKLEPQSQNTLLAGKLGRSPSPSSRPSTPRSEMQQRIALSSG